jgi:hypothetical protein
MLPPSSGSNDTLTLKIEAASPQTNNTYIVRVTMVSIKVMLANYKMYTHIN